MFYLAQHGIRKENYSTETETILYNISQFVKILKNYRQWKRDNENTLYSFSEKEEKLKKFLSPSLSFLFSFTNLFVEGHLIIIISFLLSPLSFSLSNLSSSIM